MAADCSQAVQPLSKKLFSNHTSSHLPTASGAQSTVIVACPFGRTIPKAGKIVNAPNCRRDCPAPPPAAPVPAPMSCLQQPNELSYQQAEYRSESGNTQQI